MGTDRQEQEGSRGGAHRARRITVWPRSWRNRGSLQGTREALSGPQELHRVDRLAAHARLVVQMWPGGAASGPGAADDLADLDGLPDVHVDRREMPIAGGEAVAVVDLDHAAIAAAPPGGSDGAVRGCMHGLAGLGVEIEPRMHRRRAGEGIGAHAEGRGHLELAVDRLAQRHRDQRAGQPVELHPRDADAMELVLEAVGASWQPRRNERPADAVGLAHFDAQLVEHAADAARPRVVGLLKRIGGHRLALLDAIERGLDAGDHSADPAGIADRRAGARIERRVALGRNQEYALVTEGRWLERRSPRFAAAPARADGAGHIAAATVEHACPRFQCGLAADDLLELLLVLLLIEELAARNPVDLRTQFSDTILVAELHVGLPGDEPGEHVLAEGEIGCGADAPDRHYHQGADHHPEGDRSEPQLAPGMAQRIARPDPPGGPGRRPNGSLGSSVGRAAFGCRSIPAAKLC